MLVLPFRCSTLTIVCFPGADKRVTLLVGNLFVATMSEENRHIKRQIGDIFALFNVAGAEHYAAAYFVGVSFYGGIQRGVFAVVAA